jgi:hypothetical protein
VAKSITLTIGNESAKVDLHQEDAPKTVEAVWDVLPWETDSAEHSKWGNDEFWMDAPLLVEEQENRPAEAGTGAVGYYYAFPAFLCWYNGWMTDPPWNVFGRVVENLDGIQREGRRTWKENGIPMRLERGKP